MANPAVHRKFNTNMAGIQTALQYRLSARLVHGSRNIEQLFNVGSYNLIYQNFKGRWNKMLPSSKRSPRCVSWPISHNTLSFLTLALSLAYRPILTKRGFSQQILVRNANITFRENQFSGRPFVTSERTDKQDEANIRSSLLGCECAWTLCRPSLGRFVIPLPSRSLVHTAHRHIAWHSRHKVCSF